MSYEIKDADGDAMTLGIVDFDTACEVAQGYADENLAAVYVEDDETTLEVWPQVTIDAAEQRMYARGAWARAKVRAVTSQEHACFFTAGERVVKTAIMKAACREMRDLAVLAGVLA